MFHLLMMMMMMMMMVVDFPQERAVQQMFQGRQRGLVALRGTLLRLCQTSRPG